MPLRVLVVEHDRTARELITRVLQSLDLEVTHAADGKELSNMIRAERFDVIFLDLRMPHVNGIEGIKRIRRSKQNHFTNIVVVTRPDDQVSMKKAFDAGATFSLPKPIKKQQLRIMIKVIHGTKAILRENYLRIPTEVAVTCRTGTRTIRGKSLNIGVGGMLFDPGRCAIHLCSFVRLTCRLPRQTRYLTVSGFIFRFDVKRRVDIRFPKLDSRARTGIKRLLHNPPQELDKHAANAIRS